MDDVSLKVKVCSFRMKELKEVLFNLGLSMQGRKRDLIKRILRHEPDGEGELEELRRLIDDIYRRLCSSSRRISVFTDLESSSEGTTSSPSMEIEEDIVGSSQANMRIRCLCRNNSINDSMIKCQDPQCQTWQHIACVMTPNTRARLPLPLPLQFYCECCRLSRSNPFLLTVAHLLNPVKSTATSTDDGRKTVQSVEQVFSITEGDIDLLSAPELDVQVWCILLNDEVPFRMHWPKHASLQLNGVSISVITRPDSELRPNGRDDGPFISSFMHKGDNTISLTTRDTRSFCMGVRIVKRRDVQEVLRLIPKSQSPNGEQYQDALAHVIRCVNGGKDAGSAGSDSDLEIVTDSLSITLRCPLSGNRIRVPGRFRPCSHIGCFDLETYVQLQENSRKWQCPFCLKNCCLEELIVDPYFDEIISMMQSCGDDATDIEVKSDGSWRAKGGNKQSDPRVWHSPNGRVLNPSDEAEPRPESSRAAKQKGIALYSEIRKKRKASVPSSERFQGIPVDGGRDGEGTSEYRDANGMEIGFAPLDPRQTSGLADKNAYVEIIGLSDSDGEGHYVMYAAPDNGGSIFASNNGGTETGGLVRLGDENQVQNGSSSGHQSNSKEGMLPSVNEKAKSHVNDAGPSRTRKRPNSPSSSRQSRSLRQRVYIDLDSDSD